MLSGIEGGGGGVNNGIINSILELYITCTILLKGSLEGNFLLRGKDLTLRRRRRYRGNYKLIILLRISNISI
jgi:hypothetical protein